MLYSEFINGTGCRQNDHNFEVYRKLEIIYMNDEATTKEDIYEWGKKLVCNSPSPEELEQIQSWKYEIEQRKQWIEEEKVKVARYHLWALEATDKEDAKFWKRSEIASKHYIKEQKQDIENIKSLLESVKF